MAVTFVSGRNLVILGFSSDVTPEAPKDLTAVANTARKRLAR
jgi:hypothetical protein